MSGTEVRQEHQDQEDAQNRGRQCDVGELRLLVDEMHVVERDERCLAAGQQDERHADDEVAQRQEGAADLERREDGEPDEHLDVAALLVGHLFGRHGGCGHGGLPCRRRAQIR